MKPAKRLLIGLGLLVSLGTGSVASAFVVVPLSDNELLPTSLNLTEIGTFGAASIAPTSGFTYDFYFNLTYAAVSSSGSVGAVSTFPPYQVDGLTLSFFDLTNDAGRASPLGNSGAGLTFTTGVLPDSSILYNLRVTGSVPTGKVGSFSGLYQALPIPAAAWLLLSGVAGLGAMDRRRKVEPVPDN
jgi:hypothetical protein